MDSNFYEKDGLRYVRITRALEACPSPDLLEWKIELIKKFSRELSRENKHLSIEELLDKAIRKMNKIGDDAGDVGNEADNYLKAKALGEKLPKLRTFEGKSIVEAFEKWREANPEIVLTVPGTVYCEELRCAGTPDFEYGDTVLDLKGCNAIRLKNWLQTEFYGRMLGKTHKAILRCDKNLGTYEFVRVPLSDDHWEVVKSVVNLYRFYNQEERL